MKGNVHDHTLNFKEIEPDTYNPMKSMLSLELMLLKSTGYYVQLILDQPEHGERRWVALPILGHSGPGARTFFTDGQDEGMWNTPRSPPDLKRTPQGVWMLARLAVAIADNRSCSAFFSNENTKQAFDQQKGTYLRMEDFIP